MKRMISLLALVLAMVMMMTVFTACDGTNTNTTTEPQGDKVTVSWYQGSTLLKEEQVDKGSKLTSWDPNVSGKTFTGWYVEASLTQKFDFETAVNEDIDLFAAFKSDEYVADTNEYYLIGSGSGAMKDSGWDHAKSQASLMMTKDTSITDKNVYKITIDMYAGDRFQICFGGDWNGQQGIGYIPGCEYADGVNPNGGATVTAADKKYAEVKNANGEVVFIGGDEYGKESFVWNIILNEGHDGKYTFTLTTYPANAQYNTIEWKLEEKLAAQTQTHDMHMIGSFNNWDAANTDFPMKKSEDGKTWLGFVEIKPEHYVDYALNGTAAAMKVINHVDGAYYGDSTGENIFLTEGLYAVKYTVEGNVVEFEKCDYYIVGTLLFGDQPVNFSVKAGFSPKMTVKDGVASVLFTAYDVTSINDFNWLSAQGKPGKMAIKVVYGTTLGIPDSGWYSDTANNGDNFYLNPGNYNISLDIATGTVTITAA